ncbi:MAG: CAP domain-containing protein, partial [Micromonosporaceae bacterium]
GESAHGQPPASPARPTMTERAAPAQSRTASPSRAASPTPSPSRTTPGPAKTTGNSDVEDEVVRLANRERADAGCRPLASEGRLHQAALAHARDMARRNFFDHTNPDGEDAGDRIDRTGYAWRGWGENIAAGQQSAEDVMRSWMNSQGHRDNILNCGYAEIGVAMVTDDDGRSPLWVQVFATPAD